MNLRLIVGYAAPYRSSLALSATLMLVETGVALTIPLLGGRFAEHVLARGPVSGGAILLVLLALFALQALVKFGNNYLMGRASAHILADLRVRIYDHLQALPLSFYHQRRQGERRLQDEAVHRPRPGPHRAPAAERQDDGVRRPGQVRGRLLGRRLTWRRGK